MQLIFCLIALLSVVQVQASAPVPSPAQTKQSQLSKAQTQTVISMWKSAFKAGAKTYDVYQTDDGKLVGSMYKKLDGQVVFYQLAQRQENASGKSELLPPDDVSFPDVRDSWRFHAYKYKLENERSKVGAPSPEAAKLLVDIEQALEQPMRAPTLHCITWLQERVKSGDEEGATFTRFMFALKYRRDLEGKHFPHWVHIDASTASCDINYLGAAMNMPTLPAKPGDKFVTWALPGRFASDSSEDWAGPKPFNRLANFASHPVQNAPQASSAPSASTSSARSLPVSGRSYDDEPSDVRLRRALANSDFRLPSGASVCLADVSPAQLEYLLSQALSSAPDVSANAQPARLSQVAPAAVQSVSQAPQAQSVSASAQPVLSASGAPARQGPPGGLGF